MSLHSLRHARAWTRVLLALCLGVATGSVCAQNAIEIENQESDGVSTQWQIADAEYASLGEIEGYASATSVNRGASINLYVQTTPADTSYSIDIYRIGWYGGAGGRRVAGPITRSRSEQPPCPMSDPATRLVECAWTDPYVLTIPDDDGNGGHGWVSGVYLAKLSGDVSGKKSYIIFVVRDDARQADILLQTSVTTYAAYNNWGGYDLYNADSLGATAAHKVSFDRPYRNPQRYKNGKGAGEFFAWEINMVRFVEREGYDVQYATDVDAHSSPSRLLNRRMFMSVGHDEYYSREMYDAVQAARDAGVNLGFFGANPIYWQIRFEPSTLSGAALRTVVAYKAALDPLEIGAPALGTHLWRSPGINRPEAALVGVAYDYNSVDLGVVLADCSPWFCDGTHLHAGDVLPGMLGYEVDKTGPASPAGIQVIARSPYNACLTADCTAKELRYANATYYTAASGAQVFATGTMQWNWGLDAYSAGDHGNRSNDAVQQMTRNVLSRFTAASTPRAPRYTSTPATSAIQGAAYVHDVNAIDDNGETLSYALTQMPAGMVIDAVTGLITWTPSPAQLGPQEVAVSATDPGGLFTLQSFTVEVSLPATTRVDRATPGNYVGALGGNVGITLNWYRLPMAANYLQFMTLINGSGQFRSVDDHGTTSATWAAGAFSETRMIAIPANLTPGSYDIYVGLAGGTTFANVPLVAGAGVVEFGTSRRYKVGSLKLGNAPRIASTPPVSARATFAYSYQVQGYDNDNDALSYTLSQAPPGMVIDGSTGDISWTPDAAQSGPQTVEITVTDPLGLTAVQAYTLDVAANAAPTLDALELPHATSGLHYRYALPASDADGDSLSYALDEAPAGMTLDPSSGVIEWTPDGAAGEPRTVTVWVSDGGLVTTRSYALSVAANSPPTLDAAPDCIAHRGRRFEYLLHAFDVDGEVLSYALTTAPSGMQLDGVSGRLSWTPETGQLGAQTVAVQVSDPGGQAASTSFTVLVDDDGQLLITSSPVTAAHVERAYQYTVTASDIAGMVLRYSLTNAPAGMSMDPASGVITWLPEASQSGVQEVSVEVRDSDEATASQSFTIEVTPNRAPQFVSLPVTSGHVLRPYSYAALASDVDGDPLRYALTSAPTGMHIDADSGAIAWLPETTQDGAQAVTVEVSDAGGLRAVQSFVVDVTPNHGPRITSQPLTTAVIEQDYGYGVLASDEDGDVLNFELTTAPAGMAIDAASGVISWSTALATSGAETVTVRVTDAGGLSDSQTFVLDVLAPFDPSTARQVPLAGAGPLGLLGAVLACVARRRRKQAQGLRSGE